MAKRRFQRRCFFCQQASMGEARYDDICARHVCLPVHSDMTEEEATQVIAALGSQLHAARTRQTS